MNLRMKVINDFLWYLKAWKWFFHCLLSSSSHGGCQWLQSWQSGWVEGPNTEGYCVWDGHWFIVGESLKRWTLMDWWSDLLGISRFYLVNLSVSKAVRVASVPKSASVQHVTIHREIITAHFVDGCRVSAVGFSTNRKWGDEIATLALVIDEWLPAGPIVASSIKANKVGLAIGLCGLD